MSMTSRCIQMAVLCAGLLASCAAPGPAEAPVPRVQRTVITMGTALTVTALGAPAEAAVERAIQRIHAADRRWSSWRDDSLLSRVHASAPDTPVLVDAEFRLGWQLARAWSERTDGAFDPGIGALLASWGIGKGGLAKAPERTDLARARSAANSRCFHIEGDTITRTHSDARIAEGGFVKGLALDAAIAAIVREFPGLERITLDFGGQLAWWERTGPGNSSTSTDRTLVAHPRHRSRAVASIAHGAEGSLATSGNSQRGISIDGRQHSHILDPRTGKPARDWGSVTVLVTRPTSGGGSACAADCLSTALFVLGPDAGHALANRLPGVEALFLEYTNQGLRWHLTDGMPARLRRLADPSDQTGSR